MKTNWPIIVMALALSACANHSKTTPYRTAPSVGAVRSEVVKAQHSNDRALQANDRVGRGLDKATTYADIIDYKATILLERHRRQRESK